MHNEYALRRLAAAKPALMFPCLKDVQPDLAFSLAKTVKWLTHYGIEFETYHIVGHANTPRARNLLLAQALGNVNGQTTGFDGTHNEFVFIDSDIGWEFEEFLKLWDTPDFVQCVAAAPQRRTWPQISMCSNFPDRKVYLDEKYNLALGRVATAFMRFKREPIKKLQALHPEWKFSHGDLKGTKAEDELYAIFHYEVKGQMHSDSDDIHYVGEDFLFCDRLAEIGVDTYIKTDLRTRHWHSVPLDKCLDDAIRSGGQIDVEVLEAIHIDRSAVAEELARMGPEGVERFIVSKLEHKVNDPTNDADQRKFFEDVLRRWGRDVDASPTGDSKEEPRKGVLSESDWDTYGKVTQRDHREADPSSPKRGSVGEGQGFTGDADNPQDHGPKQGSPAEGEGEVQ